MRSHLLSLHKKIYEKVNLSEILRNNLFIEKIGPENNFDFYGPTIVSLFFLQDRIL